MKMLKNIGLGLLIAVALLAVIGFFLPAKMNMERSTVINAPVANIYDQINILKNWEQWSPWVKMDPGVKMSFAGPASGEGAMYSWDGEKTGKGTMTITKSTPEEIITSLSFDGDDGKPAVSGFRLSPEGDATKLTWYFNSEVGANPMHRWMMVIMKGMMGDQFAQGLASIKEIAEKMPVKATSESSIKVEELPIQAMEYLGVRDTANVATISMKMGTHYGEIMAAMSKQGLKQRGPVFARYFTDSETNFDFEAAIPVDKAGKADGNVKPGKLAAGKAVIAHYYGGYMGTPAGHIAVKQYLEANNKKVIGAPWEMYVTDPTLEKDSSKWLTEICYPVE
jgi:effector-binding domain-containing protein